MNLAKYIKDIRLKAGITQMEMAGLIGYTNPMFVSYVESGTKLPSCRYISTLCKKHPEHKPSLLKYYFEEQRKLTITKLKKHGLNALGHI